MDIIYSVRYYLDRHTIMSYRDKQLEPVRIALPSRLDAVMFEYGLLKDKAVELHLAPTKDIPRMLFERKVDCALVPSVMYFQGEYLIVPDVSISTFFRMSTEVLVSSKPLPDVRSVALPRQPDTSRVILEIALRELFPETPFKFEIGTGNPYKDLENCDAAVVSGEGALGIPDNMRKNNIGEFWVRLTDLPAVFYLWLTHADYHKSKLEAIYAHVMLAKKTGINQSDRVIRFARERVTLNKYKLIEYLTVEIDYDLFSQQIKSLRLLGDYLKTYKLIPEGKSTELKYATERSHVSVFESIFGTTTQSIDDLVIDWQTEDYDSDEE